MFNRPLILPAIAMAALFSFPSVVNAANHAPLERWRSYAGVSWDTAQDGKIPAAFSGSVNAPIAGIHFDAKDRPLSARPGWFPPQHPPR